jgi:DNA-binding IclR family transcriptional regulator
MVTRAGHGLYDVALAFADRLRAVSPTDQAARIARPKLQRLAQATGATAHLGVLDTDMVTYLVKAHPPGRAQSSILSRENTQLEAYCSAIGKVLLAALPPCALERYLAAGPFVALTPRTITDPAVLRTHLAQVRVEARAEDTGEIDPHLHCIAVPIPGAHLAVSLSFAGTAPSQAALARLRRCAAAIGARLEGLTSTHLPTPYTRSPNSAAPPAANSPDPTAR